MSKQFALWTAGPDLRRPEKMSKLNVPCHRWHPCVSGEFNFHTSDQASDTEAIELQMFSSTTCSRLPIFGTIHSWDIVQLWTICSRWGSILKRSISLLEREVSSANFCLNSCVWNVRDCHHLVSDEINHKLRNIEWSAICCGRKACLRRRLSATEVGWKAITASLPLSRKYCCMLPCEK